MTMGFIRRGINLLRRIMSGYGEVIVVAPQSDQSGMSHALTLNRPLRVQKLEPGQYVLDGSPADCVHFAIQDLYGGKGPDLLVSGINHGANLGGDVWYSGTVGAAIEGSLMGVKSIAVSVVSKKTGEYHFESAIEFLENRFTKFLELGSRDPSIIYNINIPSEETSDAKNIEFTRLGSKQYRSTLVSKVDPRGKAYFWIGGEKSELDREPGTDSNAIRNGSISITPVHLNMTDVDHLKDLSTCEL